MESIAQAILSLKSGPSLFDYITVVGAIIAALLAIFTIYKIFSEISHQRKQFIEAQNQKERENLTQKLNRFFGPLKELRSESKTLYDHFAISEKEQAKESEGKRFRTLRHLTQGKTFSEPDLALLGEIIKVGKKQLKLIEKEGNIITNAQLATYWGNSVLIFGVYR